MTIRFNAAEYCWVLHEGSGWKFMCACRPGGEGQRTAQTLMERELYGRAGEQDRPQWGRVAFFSEVGGDRSEAGVMLFRCRPNAHCLSYWFPRGSEPTWDVFASLEAQQGYTSGPEDGRDPPLDRAPAEGWALEAAEDQADAHTGAPEGVLPPEEREAALRSGLSRAEGWGAGKLAPLPSRGAPSRGGPARGAPGGALPQMRRR